MRLLTHEYAELPIANEVYDYKPEQFKDYCTANNIYYYGKPAEDFSEIEAFRLANDNKCLLVLLDNLS